MKIKYVTIKIIKIKYVTIKIISFKKYENHIIYSIKKYILSIFQIKILNLKNDLKRFKFKNK